MNQRVLVLVGLPGSGKSTFSKKLVESKSDWARINQDDLRSRRACEIQAEKCLREKKSIVVDRCNFDPDQRRTWVKLAAKNNVPAYCLILTTTDQVCDERIMRRENHPTDVSGVHGVSILKKFMKTYKPPKLGAEDFEDICTLDPSNEEECTVERIDAALKFMYPDEASQTS